jgi:hypothetical protein
MPCCNHSFVTAIKPKSKHMILCAHNITLLNFIMATLVNSLNIRSSNDHCVDCKKLKIQIWSCFQWCDDTIGLSFLTKTYKRLKSTWKNLVQKCLKVVSIIWMFTSATPLREKSKSTKIIMLQIPHCTEYNIIFHRISFNTQNTEKCYT